MRSPAACSAAMASAADGLIGSATASRPSAAPSAATYITLAPSPRSASACACRAATSTPSCCINAVLPMAAALPSTVPRTPMPVADSKSLASANASPRRCASATIAAASGCSLPASRLAASRNSASASPPATGTASRNVGLPSVSVPVLSTISVSTVRRRSMASASRNSTPARAARPVATITVIGVASPSAHGQATISTDTALSTAKVQAGAGPNRPQASSVSAATASTASTNQNATLPTSRCIGARERCACATGPRWCAPGLSPPMLAGWLRWSASALDRTRRIRRAPRCPARFRTRPGWRWRHRPSARRRRGWTGRCRPR